MTKALASTVLLTMLAFSAAASQQNISAPLRHSTFSYDDTAWEGRTDPRQPANYSIRLHDGGIVFSIIEEQTPKGLGTADKVLAKIEGELRRDFEMTPSERLDRVTTPQGWSCRSFQMSPIGSTMQGLSRTCVKVVAGVYERMTIIVPADSINDASVEALNAVIGSIKDV